MPVTIYPDRTLTLEDLDFGGFTTDDFGDYTSPMNDANFGYFDDDLLDEDYEGFTTDDFGDFSSPYNDGDYMSFASPGALSNDYGTF